MNEINIKGKKFSAKAAYENFNHKNLCSYHLFEK